MTRKKPKTISDRPQPHDADTLKHEDATKGIRSRQDMDVLITRTCCMLDNTFKNMQKGETARLINTEFENFDMPKMTARFKIKPTPSNIVLGTDLAVIKLSELSKYEAILARVREQNQSLRTLEDRIEHVNREIWKCFMDTKILYRGMGITEFCTIAKMRGVVGFHRRTRYAKVNDFVSCSIHADAAAVYAISKKKKGLIIEMDVSRMRRADYAPVTYDARRNIRVTRRGRHVYTPYEMFGGHHAGMFMNECEIHLRAGSRPIITGVRVPGERSIGFRKKLDGAARVLEAAQGRKIMIKYEKVQ